MRFRSALVGSVLGLCPLAATAVAAAEKRAHAPEVDLDTMVRMPSGTFRMGMEQDLVPGPYGDPWFADQKPAHDVTLSEFWIDRTEVTVAQFALFLTWAAGEYHFHPDQPIERVEGGYLPIAGRGDEPIHSVTWQAADHYCRFAGKRLPTEAEWERAAAGTRTREYPWGVAGPSCTRTNHLAGGSSCHDGVRAVASLPDGATPEGILDLAGNVAEWVADRYGPYLGTAQVDPVGSQDDPSRVIRGGSYLDHAQLLRTRARSAGDPNSRSIAVGFRCAYAYPPEDGAIRGQLAEPEDVNREATDRPVVPPAPLPEILASNLATPVGVVTMNDRLYALERGAGRLVEVNDDGSTSEVVGGMVEPAELVASPTHLYVSDRGDGTIVAIDDSGDVVELATDFAGVGPIAFASESLYFATPDAIGRVTEDGAVESLASVPGVVALASSASHLYYAAEGAGVASAAAVGRLPLDGGTIEVLVDSNIDVFYATYPVDLAWDAERDTLWYLRRRRANMPTTTLCRLEGGVGPLSCPFHGLTYGTGLTVHESRVYFSGLSVVVSLDPDLDRTYSILGPWSTASPSIVPDGDQMVWADPGGGRILRAPP